MRCFIAAIFLMIHCFLFSQEIDEKKVDEFTGDTIVTTTWLSISKAFKVTTYTRALRVNSKKYLNFKMMLGMSGKVFSIDKGDKFMIKLSDGEVLTLKNSEHTVTCKGCGAKGFSGSAAQGIDVTYPISGSQIESLTSTAPEKLRVYTSKGHVELKVTKKKGKELQNSFKLINW